MPMIATNRRGMLESTISASLSFRTPAGNVNFSPPSPRPAKQTCSPSSVYALTLGACLPGRVFSSATLLWTRFNSATVRFRLDLAFDVGEDIT
jgi:hypothetical protein